jgi:formylglycine-generating enzyme required for sulfatase activity
VDGITWEECQDVLLRLGLELPTEAQWEYAVRAGKAFVWPTGNGKYSLAGHANLLDKAALRIGIRAGRQVEEWLDDGYRGTAPVGSFTPNAYGLYDMTGNVYEWCRDKFDTYDCLVSEGDGEHISVDDRLPTFILRGGSYDTLANGARSSFRVDQEPTRRSPEVGVRPAMSLDG